MSQSFPAAAAAPSPAATRAASASGGRTLLSRVPEVTIFFWIIKILATTVGETAADNLNDTLGFGLTWTTVVMSVLLIGVMFRQFKLARYVSSVYWLAVVLISVVGTLITDNLTDRFGVSPYLSTGVFSVLLALTFFAWWRQEGTLSIHSIVTAKRERFYWLAILFTFALGTAAGDLIGEQVGLGYFTSVLVFAAVIAAITVAHLGLKAGAVLSFWLAYIVTRPLGASMGDWMSQPKGNGGLALGTTGTSLIFLAAILVVVSYLSVTKIDREVVDADATDRPVTTTSPA